MSSIRHYLRFGSSKEIKILKHQTLKRKSYGLTMNANVVAHTPVSIYKMLFLSFPDVDFFIDPQTYIVQLDPLKYYSSEKIINEEKVTQLKNSVQTMLTEYGEPVSSVINDMQRLDNRDLENNIDELTKNVIDFQKHFLSDNYESRKEDDGYDDYSAHDDYDEKTIIPQYVIPPYFFLSLDENGWLDLNKRAIQEALKIEEPEKIAAEIVIEKQILFSDSYANKIVETYNSIDEIKTLLIWMDNFNETEVSSGYLKRFAQFLEKFENKNIINLYGGHFSLLLCKKGTLKGFCHGPGYGEHRGVKPVGGGIPTAKYYLPYISKRIDFELALQVLKKKDLLNKRYFSEICNCQICRQLLSPEPNEINIYEYAKYMMSSTGKSQIPTEDTLINNQLHYLLKRFSDIKNVNLQNERERFRDFILWNNKMKIVSTQHLENWLKVLDEREEF
jgi:hypothetical protein